MISQEKGNKDSTLNLLNQQLLNFNADNQFVTFQIREEEYGIDIMLVQEIIRYCKSTRVFNANPYVKGLINFRGKVIPVIDMHLKFNLPEPHYDSFTVIIVVEVAKKTVGMIVDRVSDIVSFNQEDIQLIDREMAEDIRTDHLKGLAKSGERMILLLEPKKVISYQELLEVEEVINDN